MRSFFKSRQEQPPSASAIATATFTEKIQEEGVRLKLAPIEEENVPSQIYAPFPIRPALYGLGERLNEESMLSSAITEARIGSLQPSKRRAPPETSINDQNGQRALNMKTRKGEDSDDNMPEHKVPFPSLYPANPSGTFGPPTIREQTMARLKNGPQYESSSRERSQSEATTSTFYSLYNSSSSTINPIYDFSTPSSSHTFGTRTPARSNSSSRRTRMDEIFFNHLETPPPLPPLNHPAFLASSQDGLPESQSVGRSASGKTRQFLKEKEPRHSWSLPSIRRPTPRERVTSSISIDPTRPRRRESKPSLVSKPEENSKTDVDPARKRHAKSQSKSSMKSNLSRRSSAEYSAKQASLLGAESQADSHESWEVQVSKELLRLSLTQEVAVVGGGHPSTRGANVGSIKRFYGESGAARGSGPAFSFPDTSSLKQDHPHHRAAAVGKAGHPLGTLSSIDSAILTSSMSESHGSNVSKGILNPSTGKFRPKAGPRQVRSKSSPERARTPSPPPPKLDTISAVSGSGLASSSLLAPPVLSFTAPTPEASPISPKRRAHHKSTPTHPASVLRTPPPVQKSHSSGSTKRKADEAEVDSVTPPREREHKTTFAPEPRTHRASANSGSSHAPSSFHRSKRVRTSLPPPDPHGSQRSAAPSLGDSPNAKSTGSWSSKNSKASASHVGPYRSSRPPSTKDVHAAGSGAPRRSDSRRSLSQASIPISAFMSPHAPSISRSSTFHMRDPRKPSRIQATPWTLSFPDEVQDGASKWALKGWTDRGGSPLHAWLFFIGFIIFPLWWLAGFAIPIPRTRRLESGDAEKGVVLDDPQVEHDYKSWRRRCRIMTGVSILTYIPFIVLVAIFA